MTGRKRRGPSPDGSFVLAKEERAALRRLAQYILTHVPEDPSQPAFVGGADPQAVDDARVVHAVADRVQRLAAMRLAEASARAHQTTSEPVSVTDYLRPPKEAP